MNIFSVMCLATIMGSLHCVNGCGTNNVQCVTETTYQSCITIGGQQTATGAVLTCATGTVCTETGTTACIAQSTTISTTITSTITDSTSASTTPSTTAAATGPPQTCTEAGRYPADVCEQYWECLLVMWWYELVLQTCDSGLTYNATSQQCDASGACANSTTTTTTITVTPPATSVTGPPQTCTEAGRYPADVCEQYWECLLVMWWYELVLQTCDSGLTYNATSQQCDASGACANSTTTTTTAAATTTATTASVTTVTTPATSVTGPPERCTEAGRYPAPDACNQYWECILVMWWYELVQQTCEANQAYDPASQTCIANSTCIL